MNIQAQSPKTTFEAALLERFAERLPGLPGNDDTASQRVAAIEALEVNGLPTRRIEAWHYTDLKRLLSNLPGKPEGVANGDLAPLLAGSNIFRIVDGAAAAGTAVSGASVTDFAEALVAGEAAALAPRNQADAVGILNTAFVTGGLNIDVDAGSELAAPLEIQNMHSGGQVDIRVPVTFGPGAKGAIVERQCGAGGALVSAVTDLDIREQAEVTWLIVQEQQSDTDHLGQINIKLGNNARLTLFIMNTGGRTVRQEINVAVAGEGADFTLRAVNLLSGESHTDVTMVLDHEQPNATSSQVIRNVVVDRARGVFQGQIRVASQAQKTDAKMACNTLLLSDDGEFSAKPELEIFADDVQCGHGATVAEIEEDQLFYLMSRGIPEKSARGLLVKAFLAEIIEELEDEQTVTALEEKLDHWFEKNG